MDITTLLKQLQVHLASYEGNDLSVTTPIDGSEIARLRYSSQQEITEAVARSMQAFQAWRDVPAPKRGELVRVFGEVLREYKEPLAQLVTIECGKIIEEGRGEVQEMIDICDFAVGLSRQLYGLTIASERPSHTMQERWLPLGPVGIISAFNFPVAVWSWNVAIAWVCGDSTVWKPSEKTPLTAIACQRLFELAVERADVDVPAGLSNVLIGEASAGQALVEHPDIALVSATGSTRMGQAVGPDVIKRFGKCLLELGGNNPVVVSDKADLDIALPSILFGAVGTCGQRCTSTRRAFVHRNIYDEVAAKLRASYQSIIERKIGDPLDADTLVGPLIDQEAATQMQQALETARKQGARVHFGEALDRQGAYVAPALVELEEQVNIVKQETFAPILYLMPYDNLVDAIDDVNDVEQGLSAAIFTTDIREAEYFRERAYAGIVNVNIGTSGAEIGGAFGGEKATGGGRESGSDAWKQYMRRITSTTYIGYDAPALAQGVQFDVAP